ncbi:hypothetical protein HanRHA438_Chr08g0358611 [Helianthus annuus]|nr:hypothetical protein HanRHA438_Chr08g0358611 [Helianthus annuus]
MSIFIDEFIKWFGIARRGRVGAIFQVKDGLVSCCRNYSQRWYSFHHFPYIERFGTLKVLMTLDLFGTLKVLMTLDLSH